MQSSDSSSPDLNLTAAHRACDFLADESFAQALRRTGPSTTTGATGATPTAEVDFSIHFASSDDDLDDPNSPDAKRLATMTSATRFARQRSQRKSGAATPQKAGHAHQARGVKMPPRSMSTDSADLDGGYGDPNIAGSEFNVQKFYETQLQRKRWKAGMQLARFLRTDVSGSSFGRMNEVMASRASSRAGSPDDSAEKSGHNVNEHGKPKPVRPLGMGALLFPVLFMPMEERRPAFYSLCEITTITDGLLMFAALSLQQMMPATAPPKVSAEEAIVKAAEISAAATAEAAGNAAATYVSGETPL